MSDNTGGPAFPLQDYHPDGRPAGLSEGMTLRDYFAAKAMQGCCADPNCTSADLIASFAYEMADAMLAAREVKNG